MLGVKGFYASISGMGLESPEIGVGKRRYIDAVLRAVR